jgi:uncharacterized protein (TIRG00374 family)
VTRPDRRGRRALQIIVGVAITGALAWWVFHKINFPQVWLTIRTVHVLPMAIAVVVATLPFALRVPRWRLLLRADDDETLGFAPLWQAITIGFAANNVLPLRAGEVLRVGAVSRLAPVSFASALSSVAVERVIDALTVVTLMAIGFVSAPLPGSVNAASGARQVGILCLVALAIAIIAAWQRDLALRLIRRALPAGVLSDHLLRFVDRLLSGLTALRDPRRALPVVAWSFVIWVTNAAAFYFAFRAFDFPVPFSGALVLQGILTMGIALPSTPGFVLVFEGAIVAALALYGIPQVPAFALAVLYHFTTFIPITAFGAWSAVRTGTRLRTPPATP